MSERYVRVRARREDWEPRIREALDAGMTRAAAAAFAGCFATLVCRVMRDLGLWQRASPNYSREKTQSEIAAELIQADQRWRSVAQGLRYENTVEAPFRPTRFAMRRDVPITCAAALMVDS